MSARHFKTPESSTPNWYERQGQAVPQDAEQSAAAAAQAPADAAQAPADAAQAAATQPDDTGNVNAATVPMEEPYANFFEASPAAEHVGNLGDTDPALARREPVAAAEPMRPAAAHIPQQDAPPDYTPEFDFEPKRSGLRSFILFLVVFAIFFCGAYIYLHFFAR